MIIIIILKCNLTLPILILFEDKNCESKSDLKKLPKLKSIMYLEPVENSKEPNQKEFDAISVVQEGLTLNKPIIVDNLIFYF